MRHTCKWTRARNALLPATALAAGFFFLWPAPGSATDKPGYAVGDRLKPAAAPASRPQAEPFRTLAWEDLTPPGWDPMKAFDASELRNLQDGDPRARAALEKLRKAWDNAPVRSELNNARVRLPGFVVPLSFEGKVMREFLLVPYYGACVHAPPPPSNQVVHVVMDKPAKGVEMMDTIWVSGRMRVASFNSEMGAAGYRIDGVEVAPYTR
ncbi:MAG TPA: DUF3299 domain-containing protein [Ramlibacter sp.]|nr:DUF3299 domain-containing protein [Ramlibacter sp.]